MTGLQFGRVVKVHPEAHAVDVVLMEDGRRLSGVQILSGSAGGDYGRHGGLGIPTEEGYEAKTTRKRDVFCAVAWVGRNPVVMGFLFPQVTQMLFEGDDDRTKQRMIDRHPSDVYSQIDGDGNFEMRHPSGAYIRIAEDPSHEDLESKDYLERWKIEKNTDKRVHIHVSQAGGKAWVDIDPDGNIVVNGPVLLCQTPKMIVEGNVTIDGTLHVTGDVGTEGNLHADGDIGAGGDVVSGGGTVSLNEHKHTGVQSGPSQTGGPIGGGSDPAMPPADEFTPDEHLPATP
jgi:hypothetical protein